MSGTSAALDLRRAEAAQRSNARGCRIAAWKIGSIRIFARRWAMAGLAAARSSAA